MWCVWWYSNYNCYKFLEKVLWHLILGIVKLNYSVSAEKQISFIHFILFTLILTSVTWSMSDNFLAALCLWCVHSRDPPIIAISASESPGLSHTSDMWQWWLIYLELQPDHPVLESSWWSQIGQEDHVTQQTNAACQNVGRKSHKTGHRKLCGKMFGAKIMEINLFITHHIDIEGLITLIKQILSNTSHRFNGVHHCTNSRQVAL